jgi:hypothetical protein
MSKELYTALSNAQGKIENAKKTSLNPHFKSKYTDLAAVWDACREAMTSEGLAVVQLPCEAPPGQVGLLTIITHKSGQSLQEKFFMPVAQANNPQAVGSALTYAKRYALLGAAGIAPEDDDGNAASARPGVTVAAPAKPAQDWTEVSKDMTKAVLALLADKNTAGARSLFSEVRSSNMDEPAKTTLLTSLANAIRETEAAIAAVATAPAGKKK